VSISWRAFDTPIDVALPFVIATVLFWAWIIRRSPWMTAVLAAVPALVIVEIAIPDERLRLLAIGVLTAAAFSTTSWIALRPASMPSRPVFLALGISATLFLRWIPLAGVEWKKEWIVLAGVTLVLALAKERTPLALALALIIGLVTPLHPGRMVFYPALVALAQTIVPWPVAGALTLFAAAAVVRYSLAALYILAGAALLVPLAARWSPVATRVVLVFAAIVLALWPWSGAVAPLLPLPVAGTAIAAIALLGASGRVATIAGTALLLMAPPLFFGMKSTGEQISTIGAALESSQSVDVAVPPDVRIVVLRISGANMPRMRPGRVVGEIDATDRAGHRTTRVLRIGDVADWGFLRREQFFFSKNVPSRNASGDVRGYGNVAFLYGAGRIPIRFAAPPAGLRVVAANDLPPGARLQVETVEYRTE
jgi:hypothetical protein